MKRSLRALAVSTLLAVTLGGSIAFANCLLCTDEKNYAGSSCQPATAADSGNVHYALGTARNSSPTAALLLECPLIKDQLNSQINSGFVGVVDQNPRDRVTCVIRSVKANNGVPLFPFSFRTVATGVASASSNVQHLPFGVVGNPGDFGYSTMDCKVPATATVRQ